MIFGKHTAIAGAVALVVIWPLASGQISQSMYDQKIKQFQTPYAVLTRESYDRGYLSSDIVTKISLIGAVKKQLDVYDIPTTYVVNSHVSHGVLSISSDSTLKITPELKVITNKFWPNGESPLFAHLETSILGDTQYNMTFTGLNAKDEEMMVTSAPLIINGEMNKKHIITFDISWPFLNVNSPLGDKTVAINITGTGRGRLVDDIWVGSQSINVEAINIDTQSSILVNMNNLTMEVKNMLYALGGGNVKLAAANDLRFNTENKISIEKFNIQDVITLHNCKIVVGFNAFAYNAMTTLALIANVMRHELTEQNMLQMITTLDSLVAKGLSIKLNSLEIGTLEGHINANADLTLESGLSNVSQNIKALPNKIKGDVNISVPLAYVVIFPKIRNMIDRLEKYGFVSQKEGILTVNAKIKGNQIVSLTGQNIPVGLLIILMM
ncbi:DUF945 family protein [Candidatus Enterovibrio altilux]|uniref:Uncharacterized protein n=1 Tax=Candidatus Enterovibrio altilux TaxID=1927128 RepID=A0A291BBC7_9GAMM|nr:DUF945 family protein [Candidatus Enterovibrio luxaltus]ATF10297.1 hypothetical protein BTN50_1877 [Candidatus Enterovibrio luxaltus]